MVIKKITTLLRVETLSFRRSCGIHPAERKTWPQRIAEIEENGSNGHAFDCSSASTTWKPRPSYPPMLPSVPIAITLTA